MLELLLEFLWSKVLSAPSFGHYWKQPIGRPYSTTGYSLKIISANFQIDILKYVIEIQEKLNLQSSLWHPVYLGVARNHPVLFIPLDQIIHLKNSLALKLKRFCLKKEVS